MPFKLRKAPNKNAYWVVDVKGKKYSKEPISKEMARKQQRAIYRSESLRGGITSQKFLNFLHQLRSVVRNDLGDWTIDSTGKLQFDSDFMGPLMSVIQAYFSPSEYEEINNSQLKKNIMRLFEVRHINEFINLVSELYPRQFEGPIRTFINDVKSGKSIDEQIDEAHELLHIVFFKLFKELVEEYVQEDVNLSKYKKEFKALSKRGGAMPDELNILQSIAKQSYNLTDPLQNIDGWELVRWTPTMKFYMKGNDVIVGVRGTKTTEDVGTWYTIPFDLLSTTGVYQRDEKELRAFQKDYPTEYYTYYAVGHSLGGAIIDNLIRRGLIQEATSYNPAIEYSDVNRGLPHRRIYYGNDPLYRIMGWWDRNSEHRDSKYGQWIDILTSFSPIPSAILGLEAHNLKNFTGGSCCSSCEEGSSCGGNKLKFVKKYLKGCGIPASKKNMSKVLDAMDCEGVVFE